MTHAHAPRRRRGRRGSARSPCAKAPRDVGEGLGRAWTELRASLGKAASRMQTENGTATAATTPTPVPTAARLRAPPRSGLNFARKRPQAAPGRMPRLPPAACARRGSARGPNCRDRCDRRARRSAGVSTASLAAARGRSSNSSRNVPGSRPQVSAGVNSRPSSSRNRVRPGAFGEFALLVEEHHLVAAGQRLLPLHLAVVELPPRGLVEEKRVLLVDALIGDDEAPDGLLGGELDRQWTSR